MLRLLLFVLLLFSVSANAQTIIDSLTVTPPTIDVSGGDQFATVTAYLRHSPGSLSIVYIFFGHPDSSTLIGFALLTSGTASDGTWEGQVYVPQSTPPGTYPVYLLAYDDVFNLETINTGKSVPITGGESEPPVLASMPVVTPSSIDVSGGPDTAIVDFDLTDNSSGVAIAYAGFERGDTLTIATGFASLVSGDILNGSWRAIVIIPQNANGQFDLRITAYDHASNYLDTNIGPALTVTGGDTILPSILGTPILDRSAVNVGGGDQDVTVTLTAMDTYSGIESINAYFSDDTGNSAGYSYLTTLVSGDSLSGTWELNTTFDSFTPEGTYHLLVGLADVSGNYTELTFTGITVVVSRAPEADVTFRLDTRRLERLGLLRRGSGTDPTVHIFEDPNTGTYSMDDGNNDSIWTITTLIQTGQTLHYAFALPASGGDVFELGGEAGGRSVPVDSQGALILPVRSFDDIPPSAVDPGYAVVLNSGFSPGDPSVYNFTVDTIRTFFSIDFASLDRNAIVAVRRYGSTPGGSLPGGIVTMAPLYWGIASAPAAAVFNGKTIFAYNFFGGVSDPSTLRLLRRTDNGQPWAVVPTLVDQDQRTLEAVGISGFSEWTIGSTNPANSLVPAIPGLVSNPNPPDSSSGVAGFPTLFWNPAQGAYNYDLYLWPAAEAMPGTPTISNLIETQYQPYPALAYGVQYNWLVVAKNITGSTQGPVWTFSTQQVADLVVTDVQVPPGAFSGQAAEITWTVTNNGATGTTAPAWQDRIYFSTDSILTTITDPVLGTAPNMSALGPGESYTNHGTFIIPNGTFGVYRIIVVSDLFDSQPESNGGNNIFIRDLTVSLTPPPDLQVDVVSVPALGFSGQTVALQYTVKNHGTNPTTSSLWDDIVYLSRDSVLVPATSWFLRTFRRTAALLPESSYTITDNIRLPDTVSGPLFVHVWTDYRNFVFEYAVEDNNMRHAPITVNLSPPPDLVVTNVSAPATGNSGSAVSVTWTVANPGSADVTRNWYDRVMIAKGAAYNPDSVTVLGTFSSVRPLQRDSSYTRQENVTLPNGISGTYYLHVEADWQRKIFESIFDSNNVTTAATPTVVALSPWPDLVVTNIAAPSAATANDIITVGWTVTDNGSGAVSSGLWTDSVYLSSSGTWDSSNAVALIGVDQNQPLAAAGSYTAQAQVRIPPGTTGGT
ncbi:MAG TPA: CARDB domain-containing protein, partial [Bacteroidota bacterium]|nr:CARDB domain-containing protein [Bacteroidota bacterium]